MATAYATEENLALILTFEDARNCVKSKIATFHMLLGKREEELLSEIDRLEAKNRILLEPLEKDLKKLELTLQQLEENLRSNTLSDLCYKQTRDVTEQIEQYGTKVGCLKKVCLNWEIKEDCFETFGSVSIYRTRRFERDTISPLLSLETKPGDTLYIVSDAWAKKWSHFVNIDSSTLMDDDSIMEDIPIDNVDILGKDLDSVDIFTLHSDAWKLLLSWHGLSKGSYPISSQITNLDLNSSHLHSKLRLSYRIFMGKNRGCVQYTYLYPTDTFQDLFDVAMKDISSDREFVRMEWRSKNRRASFIHNFSDVANVVTDLTKQIGTDSKIRYYFRVSV